MLHELRVVVDEVLDDIHVGVKHRLVEQPDACRVAALYAFVAVVHTGQQILIKIINS